MDILELLQQQISALSKEQNEIKAYAQYRYCFGVAETLLMLGEISSDEFQRYSQDIRNNFDALSFPRFIAKDKEPSHG